MKYFYISSVKGKSGISRYSRFFYENILMDRGYIFIDSSNSLSDIFTAISSKDYVHIEIGIFQKKETEILMLMLKANYRNVVITLHDPPLLKYPQHEFSNAMLNAVSRLYDRFVTGFGKDGRFYEKIRTIYVLSNTALAYMKSKYTTGNFEYLPHLVHAVYPGAYTATNRNFIYMGFIGRNKGLEYALKLHKNLLDFHPDIQFYIAGTALGKEAAYLDKLRKNYSRNVHYLGYADEAELTAAYRKSAFSFSLFRPYRFYFPVSGSLLRSMSEGTIVLTNRVNCIPDLVKDQENGIFLSLHLDKDLALLKTLFEDEEKLNRILDNQMKYLRKFHSIDIVKQHLQDGYGVTQDDSVFF